MHGSLSLLDLILLFVILVQSAFAMIFGQSGFKAMSAINRDVIKHCDATIELLKTVMPYVDWERGMDLGDPQVKFQNCTFGGDPPVTANKQRPPVDESPDKPPMEGSAFK
jgi:hypothetical protein